MGSAAALLRVSWDGGSQPPKHLARCYAAHPVPPHPCCLPSTGCQGCQHLLHVSETKVILWGCPELGIKVWGVCVLFCKDSYIFLEFEGSLQGIISQPEFWKKTIGLLLVGDSLGDSHVYIVSNAHGYSWCFLALWSSLLPGNIQGNKRLTCCLWPVINL